ncbi:hypothetical protein EDC94DRAFT_620985, partial [Helicostylum pulchrum]
MCEYIHIYTNKCIQMRKKKKKAQRVTYLLDNNICICVYVYKYIFIYAPFYLSHLSCFKSRVIKYLLFSFFLISFFFFFFFFFL